jgi:bifunctional DNA-binding transcriptional regulator/antitoxin component of YhaV-PrlF toxin-antitoxin module
MAVSKITSKNQTTVPREVRERLGVGPSDSLQWRVEGNTARVVATKSLVERLRGVVKVGPGDVVEDVRRARELRGLGKW